ncbi:N-acetyltransferase [Fulvivirgaceae bacterium BMA10]|uniref:N-acetyltransferase n=1 Tax=Splendidivirga corallicola TaxID=3051826 RepID=A0ABT8KVP0_9BACT|nr:N-acetyltransferase [Fulvivirgaceae bacterium BMA10]
MEIRPEQDRDHTQIYEVNQLAFGQRDESELIENIRQGNNFIKALSIVAVEDKQVVGHILFTKIRIPTSPDLKLLALAPMAVHPDWQNQGIGKKLIKNGLKQAKELGFEAVIVLGHAGYYPKFGFKKASDWQIKSPFKVPEEAFMALELQDGALKGKAGTVQYGSEFLAFE